MAGRSLLLFTLVCAPLPAIALAAGCGHTVVVGDNLGGEGGSGGDGGSGNSGGGGKHDAGKDALEEFVDPGCPDAGPPLVSFECDPNNQNNGDCPLGDGCYIFVDYPDEPCGQEAYGSVCAPAGFGGQGAPCGGATDCQAGLVCVVTGSGTQCVKLCPLIGEDGCPPGLVCEPIDVEGFGGCL